MYTFKLHAIGHTMASDVGGFVWDEQGEEERVNLRITTCNNLLQYCLWCVGVVLSHPLLCFPWGVGVRV